MMGDYEDLIAKLAGKHPYGTRALDAEIAIAAKWPPIGNIKHWVNEWEDGFETGPSEGYVYMRNAPLPDTKWEAPEFTASVDATLSLIQAVLPGWAFSAGDDYHEGQCWARVFPRPREQHLGTGNKYAATVPLALCIAILNALQDQQIDAALKPEGGWTDYRQNHGAQRRANGLEP